MNDPKIAALSAVPDERVSWLETTGRAGHVSDARPSGCASCCRHGDPSTTPTNRVLPGERPTLPSQPEPEP